MEMTYIVSLITIVVTLIAGEITKRYPNIDKKKVIPIQNLIIGVLIAAVYWIITKDFKAAIAASGLLAGGIYDLLSNLKQLQGGSDNEQKS